MKKEPLELIRGSGNIYRDFDVPDADVRQLKAILAAEIIKTLDKKGLSCKKGAEPHRDRCRRFLARPQRGFPAHQRRAPHGDDQRARLTRGSGGEGEPCET